MTRIRKCCVKNCDDLTSKRHRFPKHDKSLMAEWVKNIAHPRFSSITTEQIYNTYVVCEKHFSPDCSVPGTKRGLTVDAIPTLHLGRAVSEHEEIVMEGNTNVLKDTSLHTPSTSREEGRMEVEDNIFREDRNVNTLQRTNLHTPISTPRKEVNKGGNTAFCTKSRKRRSLLSEVNVSRQTDLTPKARHFYRRYAEWGTRLAAVQRKQLNFRKRLRGAEKLSKSPNFKNIIEKVNDVTYNFIMSQIRTQPLPPRCRRYSLRDKIFALSLYKVSAKGYRFLQKVFALPSRNTLNILLSQMEMKAGINEHIFDTLKSSVQTMKPKERFCIVLFDEFHLSPSVQYDRKTDTIIGIEDCGSRKPKICTYANVFMIKGIFKLWKQPVAFNFSSGPATACQLKGSLKEVIKKCQSIGLKVVGTVCDQASNNEAVIKGMKKETEELYIRRGIENRNFGFLINNQEIIPFYDTPHIFKGLRNNLLKKDLHFVLGDGKEKVAKWKHILQLYYLDSSHDTRMCTKLTDSHVLEEKMNKMKVSHCTQTLSYQVGSLMMRIAQWNIQGEPSLDPEAVETAELILFLDKLFDSLNGSAVKAQERKPLKGACSQNSPHEEFWSNAVTYLSKWKFYCHQSKKFVTVPSLRNAINSIRAFLYLKKQLLSESFKYFLPRVFNQDALENFFGAVRNHGATNCNPNAQHFIASVKTLLINNLFSHHSPSANCEPDETVGALNTLHQFVNIKSVRASDEGLQCSSQQLSDFGNLPKELLLKRRGRVEACTLTYIAGYVAKKLKSFSDSCTACKQNILHRASNNDVDFIEARTYRMSNLTTPGDFFTYVVGQSLGYIFYALPRGSHIIGVRQMLQCILKTNINFSPITCREHPEVIDLFLFHLINCAIYHWCRQVNLILSGNGSKFSKYLSAKPNLKLIDPIKLQAWNMYVKKIKRKRKGQVF